MGVFWQVTETGIMMGAVGLSDRTVAFKVQRWIDPSLTGYLLTLRAPRNGTD